MGVARQNYEEFCSAWRVRQEVVMKELQQALDADLKEEDLRRAVEMAEKLYESYYDAMDKATKQDVLQVFTPSWKTPLEKAFLWLGGWRPSAAYLLVYALAGQKVEEELSELLAGIETPSLASLSSAQLSQINEMQIYTIKEEQLLQHHKDLLQQSIAGQPILGLVQAIEKKKSAEARPNDFLAREKHTDEMNWGHIDGSDEDQMPRIEGGHRGDQEEAGEGHDLAHLRRRQCVERFNRQPAHATDEYGDGVQRDKKQEEQIGKEDTLEGLFKCVMHEKLKRLEDLSLRADSLRRQTLAGLLEVLHTVQCAQFLLASLQLQVAIRAIGEKMKQNL